MKNEENELLPLGPFVSGDAEVYVFKNVVYRRYPNSDQPNLRNYYACSGKFRKRGMSTLHREVYKHFYGDIPDGHVVHHMDGNTLNNDIKNLSCITDFEHRSHHGPEISRKFWVNPGRFEIKCANCQKSILTNKANRYRTKVCSQKCYRAQRRLKESLVCVREISVDN